MEGKELIDLQPLDDILARGDVRGVDRFAQEALREGNAAFIDKRILIELNIRDDADLL